MDDATTIIVFMSIAIGLPLLLLILLILVKMITTSADHPFKRVRYEAGNPPYGSARRPILPQYYGYILLFIVLDPLFVLLFMTSFMAKIDPLAVAVWLMLVTLIVVPPLAYALRYATKLEYWLSRKRGG